MDLAVAYRFTGEDPAELEKVLGIVCRSLRSGGHSVFCSIEREREFRQMGYSSERIYDICRAEFKSREAILVFLRSGARSKGIELEIGDAVASGKPILLVTPRDVALYRDYARTVIEYDDVDALCRDLSDSAFLRGR